jgi:hypothetical protein
MEEQVKQNQQMPNQEGDLIEKIISEYFLEVNISRVSQMVERGLENLEITGVPSLIAKAKLSSLEFLYIGYIYQKKISEGYTKDEAAAIAISQFLGGIIGAVVGGAIGQARRTYN